MIYIGLNNSLLNKIALEQDSISEESTMRVIAQTSVFGVPNFSTSGADKKIYTINFDSVENAEFDFIKQFCVPYISQKMWVKIDDSLPVPNLLFENWAFLVLENVTKNYNYSKVSFAIKVYQL